MRGTPHTARPQAVPVTVLTGFLGAGKTTLLNRILSGNHGLRIAALVNDFGSINIDADLVIGVESGGDVISLANGCVCCNIRDDLLAAVEQVIARPEQPECIILEASGVAEPSGIAATFLNSGLRDRIRLDSITCVIDASQIFAVPEMMDLKIRQVAYSDMLILSKSDLVSRQDIDRITAWLDEHFQRYRLIQASHGNVPLDILLSAGRFDPARHDFGHEHHQDCHDPGCRHDHHRDDHAAAFSTWSFETGLPLSLEALREAARKLPANIYRAKGVIHSSDEPQRRAVLQVVGKRTDISIEDNWGGSARKTRIVVIGASGSIDGDKLTARFDACIDRSQAGAMVHGDHVIEAGAHALEVTP